MSAPQKLTDAQIRIVRDAMAKRRDLQRQIELTPSLEDWAEELGVSSRYLRDVVYNRARVVLVAVVEVA